MSNAAVFRTYPTSNEGEFLRLPLYVNVSDRSKSDIDRLADDFIEKLSGEFRFSRESAMEALDDLISKTKEPSVFDKNVFISLDPRLNEKLIISFSRKPNGGCTVYGYDQVRDILDRLDASVYDQRVVPEKDDESAFDLGF